VGAMYSLPWSNPASMPGHPGTQQGYKEERRREG
jgi:hypothetical protein